MIVASVLFLNAYIRSILVTLGMSKHHFIVNENHSRE